MAQLGAEMRSAADVAAQIDSARTRVFVSTDALLSFDVSDALKKAALRGVEVFVLLDPTTAELPDSYAPGLAAARLAGYPLNMRLATQPPTVVIIDDNLLVEGPFIARDTRPFDGAMTYATRDPDAVRARAATLGPLWQAAPRYTSFIEYFSVQLEDE